MPTCSAHAACAAEYPGSHLCYSSEYERAASTVPLPAGGAWADTSTVNDFIEINGAMPNSGRLLLSNISGNCENWTSPLINRSGMTVATPAPGGVELVFVIEDGRVMWNRREAGVWLGYEGFGEFGEEVDVQDARDVEVGLHEVCVVTVDDALHCAPYDLAGLPDESLLAPVFTSGVAQVALGAAGSTYVGASFGTRCNSPSPRQARGSVRHHASVVAVLALGAAQ